MYNIHCILSFRSSCARFSLFHMASLAAAQSPLGQCLGLRGRQANRRPPHPAMHCTCVTSFRMRNGKGGACLSPPAQRAHITMRHPILHAMKAIVLQTMSKPQIQTILMAAMPKHLSGPLSGSWKSVLPTEKCFFILQG